jgi:hypothetical protein
MHRRRLASFAAIAVAAFASLATSQSPPTPAATIKQSLEGRLELSPDAPMAIQEFRVRLNGPTLSAGGSPTVLFTPSAILASKKEGEQVRLRVVGIGETTPSPYWPAYRSVPGPESPQAAWRIPCPQTDSCEGHYGLIAEWVDPKTAETATLDWHLDAAIGVWTDKAAGTAIVEFATETVDAVAEPAIDIATARADPLRMDATHRLAQWRVTMRLDNSTASGAAVWPHVVTARLTPSWTVVESPGPGTPAACPFIDGPGDLGQSAFRAGYPGCPGGVEFEPSYQCDAGEECIAEYLVGLVWPDVRMGSAVDAGWDLYVRSIGVDGTELPVAIEVEPVPSLAMAVATTSGTLTWSKGHRDEYRYHVDVPRQTTDDPLLDDTRLPTYGILRSSLSSTGSSPLPKDFATNFGKYGGDQRLTAADGVVTNGFIADDDGPCRVGADGQCQIQRNLAAGFSEDGLPNGWEFTVTWELEIGVGLIDPDDGINIIDVTPSASASP